MKPTQQLVTGAPAHLLCPKLQFEHHGRPRTLNKHPDVQTKLKRGEISPSAALSAPWYLRIKLPGHKNDTLFCLPVKDADALRAAKDILNGRLDNPTLWAKFRAAENAKHSLTLGALAAAWQLAGYPFSKTKPRTPEAAQRLNATLARGLDFWHSVPIATADQNKIEDFVVWRRKHVRPGARFTGSRSADLELAALSSLCQWAQLTGQLEANPFELRETYTTDVKHCHEKMCDNDEQLHQLLSWFWSVSPGYSLPPIERVAAGSWICLTHLTGLRPGEPEFLHHLPALTAFPTDLNSALPGQIYPMPDGTLRMKVHRLKKGQNPQILLTPALRAFLDVWTSWLTCHNYGRGSRLLPADLITQDRVADLLQEACREIFDGDHRRLTCHGGRAYYVRVRRSQGADDPQIALELGQSSNGKLIRSTYGDPKDPVGGNLHDYLPTKCAPAWDHLRRHFALVKYTSPDTSEAR